MKQLFFLYCIFLFSKEIQSQIVFCPAGAEWHYTFGDPTMIQNEQIKYVRDSILNGETVKVLAHDRFYKHSNFTSNLLTVIKQRGDTVFMRNYGTQDKWQILYNYAASAGQSWNVTIGDADTLNGTPTTVFFSYTIIVDSVRQVLINNFPLRRLYARYNTTQLPNLNDTVIITERFGCNKFMFNYFSMFSDSDGWPIGIKDFLCYRDDVFGLKQFTNFACDYYSPVSLKENKNLENFIKVYPNPAMLSENINIDIDTNSEQIVSMTICDFAGNLLKEIRPKNLIGLASYEFDARDIQPGIYVLIIKVGDRSEAFKVVRY